jgi:Mg2+/Co2+ transporter CorB
MIQQIITMLQLDDFYGYTETIDIAKGKYKLHTSLKKGIKQAKRELINKRNGRG